MNKLLQTDGGHSDEHGLPPMSSIKRWLVTTNHKDIVSLGINFFC